MQNDIHFIGIDPSLAETGIVVLNSKGEMVHQRLCKTKSSKELNKFPINEYSRMQKIIAQIDDVLSQFSPFIVALEGISLSSRNTNVLAQLCGLNYLIRNYCYGIIMSEKTQNFYIVPPTSLKKFVTGKGNCQKDLILLEIYKRYKISFDNNNLADAYGLSKIGEALINKDVVLTKPQGEVIDMLKKQYEKNDEKESGN